ncbi:hypothetical protein ACPPVT_20450 [Angustibacter sp. McL0619]|uniref:hypothetical protein n=1 Tax=Angustibacter sp. McL0619 TaxID=3415676 RepID=UPI003CEE89D3
MSSIERKLHEALADEADRVRPATDLAERVRAVVADDRQARMRRRLRTALVALGLLAAFAGLLWGMTRSATPYRVHGGGAMDWWMLELATNVLLVALALWLGPFIKRFGRAYAADVFHDNPLTGKSYIILTDIVYYLIFTAYILFTVQFAPKPGWRTLTGEGVTPAQLSSELSRVAGILVIIGVLHGLNIVLMPVLGRLFSLNRRLAAPTTTAPSEREAIGRATGDDDRW